MILSNVEIKKLQESGYGVIGAEEDQIQAASVDITLGDSFKVPIVNRIISIGDNAPDYRTINDSLFIEAHSFVLGTTKEKIKLPNNIGAWIEGKSSIGRSGVFIQNAGWISPGFEGEITLELFNANRFSVILTKDILIGQIVFEYLSSPTTKPYGGRYLHQTGATEPTFDNI